MARAGRVESGLLVQEAASALSALGGDGVGLVLSCKRLVERHPTDGPLLALCARVLCAADPHAEAWRVAKEVDEDRTPRHVAALLPEEAVVTVIGWPELIGLALPRRGDLDVLVVDVCGGEGASFVRRLRARDVEATEVDEAGTGAAAAASGVVLLEASAVGPSGFVAPSGARAAAAVAHHAGVPVWLVAGVGRVLPAPMWDHVVATVDDDEPWAADDEVVPFDLVDVVVGPKGSATVNEVVARSDCPVSPELLGS